LPNRMDAVHQVEVLCKPDPLKCGKASRRTGVIIINNYTTVEWCKALIKVEIMRLLCYSFSLTVLNLMAPVLIF